MGTFDFKKRLSGRISFFYETDIYVLIKKENLLFVFLKI